MWLNGIEYGLSWVAWAIVGILYRAFGIYAYDKFSAMYAYFRVDCHASSVLFNKNSSW
jgi:hypothetical protein